MISDKPILTLGDDFGGAFGGDTYFAARACPT